MEDQVQVRSAHQQIKNKNKNKIKKRTIPPLGSMSGLAKSNLTTSMCPSWVAPDKGHCLRSQIKTADEREGKKRMKTDGFVDVDLRSRQEQTNDVGVSSGSCSMKRCLCVMVFESDK